MRKDNLDNLKSKYKSRFIILIAIIGIISIPLMFGPIVSKKDVDNDAYFAYCSRYLLAYKSSSVLYKGEEKLFETENSCTGNSLTNTKDYVFFDTGSVLVKIDKVDLSQESFEYQLRNPESFELSSDINRMNNKFYDEDIDLYISSFDVSGGAVLKYISGNDYKQYYIPISDARIFFDNGKINVTGFTQENRELVHYALDFDNKTHTLKNQELVKKYELNEYSSIVPSIFFEYENLLSTIDFDGETCTLNLISFSDVIKTQKFDQVAQCGGSVNGIFGDFYEVPAVINGKIYLSIDIDLNGEGTTNMIFYIIDMETLEFEKIDMANLEDKIGYNVFLVPYVDEESIYVAAQKFFTTDIYKVEKNGTYKRIISRLNFEGNRALKSIIID